MKISILDDYHNSARSTRPFGKLQGNEVDVWTDHLQDTDALAHRLKDTEALVLIRERTAVTEALLQRLPKLRLISQRGPFPHIDVPACTRQGVLVSVREYVEPSVATAELTWALILMAMRDLPRNMASLKAGKWQANVGTGVRGKTVGIFGFGRIGELVSQYAKAFDAPVLVWGRAGSLARATENGFAVASSKEQFFRESDIVSLHLPLNEKTAGIVGKDDLAQMKDTALLVNTSRAKLVDSGALLEALAAGRPGKLAVDVFDLEPLTDTAHPLLNNDKIICTPHIGFVEQASMESQFNDLFDQVLAYQSGNPLNAINPEVLSSHVSGRSTS